MQDQNPPEGPPTSETPPTGLGTPVNTEAASAAPQPIDTPPEPVTSSEAITSNFGPDKPSDVPPVSPLSETTPTEPTVSATEPAVGMSSDTPEPALPNPEAETETPVTPVPASTTEAPAAATLSTETPTPDLGPVPGAQEAAGSTQETPSEQPAVGGETATDNSSVGPEPEKPPEAPFVQNQPPQVESPVDSNNNMGNVSSDLGPVPGAGGETIAGAQTGQEATGTAEIPPEEVDKSFVDRVGEVLSGMMDKFKKSNPS